MIRWLHPPPSSRIRPCMIVITHPLLLLLPFALDAPLMTKAPAVPRTLNEKCPGRPSVGGVSMRSRNGAPSRKGWRDQRPNDLKQAPNEYAPLPPRATPLFRRGCASPDPSPPLLLEPLSCPISEAMAWCPHPSNYLNWSFARRCSRKC